MLKIKCPKCGSTRLSRINYKVRVFEAIQVCEAIDYVVEGGKEVRVSRLEIRSDESVEPFIEEDESDDLEFQCDDCSYFFNDIKTDEEMMQYAIDKGLLEGYVETERVTI